MRAQFVLRVRLLSILVFIAAMLLITRLYFIQIVHGEEYRSSALGQYVADTGEINGRRSILFTNKSGAEVAAAVMQKGWRLAINPQLLTDPKSAYERMHAVVPIDKERFFASVEKKNDPYEEVASRLTDQEADSIRELKIQGVTPVREEWRFYPGGKLASNTLGFVGYQGDARVGVYGLERYWEDTLRHGGGLYINPFAEIFSNAASLIATEPESSKGDVITSLEPTVQREVEAKLDDLVAQYSPKQVGAIIMDPKSGEVYAIATRPNYDPNTYNTVDNAAQFSNPLVEGLYEMGSILKPLTMAAAIDVGAVSAFTTYNDTGCVTKSGAKFCNFDHKARGVVSMQEVLSQSLNTGVSFAVDRMGNEKFAEYIKNYGLGEETGIDLPNEAKGNIGSLFVQGAADIDFASASFGQSIALTPIAITRALASIANNGVLPEPHITRAIRYENGITRAVVHGEGKQVLKPTTAETVTKMLVQVYDDALLEGSLKQDHYSIAAKTGTAQIAIPGGGGYYEDRYLHSFFGYFPAYDPKFIIFMYELEPHGELYASHTLAKPFSELAKFLINYYSIPPDR